MRAIGKYVVERVLGQGATGTVYLARDPGLGRAVAVKVLATGAADTPEARIRFLREAQAAGNLRHPNIVAVYDVGEAGGQPYIAMEYVDGLDLAHILQQPGPRSPEWSLDILRQICEGLAHAHRNGIVHRDVKPGNIRVTAADEVKIMDFGLARLPASTMTKSGRMLGTVQYMAPEQIEGGPVDHRADVFAVGAIAFELFAGRRPFEGDSLTDVMQQILNGAPVNTLPRTPYSPGLERVVGTALERDREARHPSLEAMHAELGALVRDTARALLGPPNR